MLRGINEETGELIPKMREMVLIQTNGLVDIMENENTFKSTYDIIKQLSEVWGELSDAQQAYLSKELAGVHRGDIFMGLMESAENLDKSLNTAMNSSGSAMAEQEKYAQSLNAKINELRESAVLLWQTLIDEGDVGNFIESLSNIVQGTNDVVKAIGGITPALTTVIGLIITLRAMSIADGLISAGKSVTSIAKSIISLSTGLKTTVAGMSAAKTALTGMTGAIGLATMAISAMVMYQNQQKLKQEELIRQNKELAMSYIEESNGISDIAKKYTEIYNSTDDTIDKKEELSKLQDVLFDKYGLEKSGIDLVNDSYEKQIQLLNGIVDSKTEASKVLMDDYSDNLKIDIGKETTYLGGKNKLTGENTAWKLTSSQKKDIENIATDINDTFGKELLRVSKNGNSDSYFINILGTPEERSKILEGMIAEIDKTSSLKATELSKAVKSSYGTITPMVEEYIDISNKQIESDKRKVESYIVQSVGISDLTKATKEQYDMVKNSIYDKYSKDTSDSAEKTTRLKNEINILNSLMPQFSKSVKESSNVMSINSKSTEEYANDLDGLINRQSDYREILDELNEYNKLSAKTIANVAKEYPELLGHMGDEETLRNKLVELIGIQEKEVQDTYANMVGASSDYYNAELMQSEDFYNAKILGDESLYKNLTGAIETYFNNLGTAYEGDLKNYQNLEQAKADTTQKLVQQLAGVWSKYFGITADGVKFDKSKFLKDNPYASEEDLLEMNRVYSEAQKMQQQFQTLANGITIEPISVNWDNKKKSSSKKDKTIADKFKKDLEEIKIVREKIEYEISLLQEKMSLAELTGDTKEYDTLANKMTVLKDELRGISEIQVGKFEGLAKLYKDTEQLGELESLIANARKQDLIDEQTYLSHIIDLTNQKYDAEKRSYDDKVRDIELQQALVKEGSESHIALEQQKVDLLIQMQQSYLEKVRKLKESNLSQDQEDVRKYVDMYYDAEMEILNMQKDMAEKAKAAKLEAISKQVEQYEEQKKAQQDIFDMTMKMIKAEHEERKKALQDEIKGYEKIINKKKEALRDEYDKENAADELAEKQKVLADIEKQLLMLEGVEGEDAKAKRIKLEEEKAKAIKDIDKFNREQLLQGQEDMLDKELENFKDKKEEEIKEIDDYLSKEGNIRDEALKRMDKKNKALYEQLKKYSNDYSTTSGAEFDKLWQTANQSIEGYTDKNLTLLDTMKLVTQELEKQKELHTQVGNSSWQDNVPNGNAGGSQTNKNVKVIQQMMANSNKWQGADAKEKERLSAENAKLGSSINAYHDQETGIWWTDKKKTKKLYDSIVGVYHKGGIVGGNTSLKSSEEFAKLLKGEVVASIPQIDNFMNKTLPRIANGGVGSYNINLSIEKLIDVDKLDNNVDIESITKRAIDGVMKNLNNGFRNKGLRPSW